MKFQYGVCVSSVNENEDRHSLQQVVLMYYHGIKHAPILCVVTHDIKYYNYYYHYTQLKIALIRQFEITEVMKTRAHANYIFVSKVKIL